MVYSYVSITATKVLLAFKQLASYIDSYTGACMVATVDLCILWLQLLPSVNNHKPTSNARLMV